MKSITEFINKSIVTNDTTKLTRDELLDSIVKLTGDWGYDCDAGIGFIYLLDKVPTNVKFNSFITVYENEEVVNKYNDYVKDAKQIGEASSYKIKVSIFKSQDLYIIGVSDGNEGFAMTIGRAS